MINDNSNVKRAKASFIPTSNANRLFSQIKARREVRKESHSPDSLTEKSDNALKTEILFNPRSMYKGRDIFYPSKIEHSDAALKSYTNLPPVILVKLHYYLC